MWGTKFQDDLASNTTRAMPQKLHRFTLFRQASSTWTSISSSHCGSLGDRREGIDAAGHDVSYETEAESEDEMVLEEGQDKKRHSKRNVRFLDHENREYESPWTILVSKQTTVRTGATKNGKMKNPLECTINVRATHIWYTKDEISQFKKDIKREAHSLACLPAFQEWRLSILQLFKEVLVLVPQVKKPRSTFIERTRAAASRSTITPTLSNLQNGNDSCWTGLVLVAMPEYKHMHYRQSRLQFLATQQLQHQHCDYTNASAQVRRDCRRASWMSRSLALYLAHQLHDKLLTE